MELKDFPRPNNDNGRGIHWHPGLYNDHLFQRKKIDWWINELKEMQIKWVKVLDDGGKSSLELCEKLLENDIFPVVRFFLKSPGHIDMRNEQAIRDLISIGVRYFETKNEPDLDVEWHTHRRPPNWLDIVVEEFIYDADIILNMGGYPAMPSLGVGTIVNPFEMVAGLGRSDIFHNGAWVAIHNYTINHPLDYPYDTVNQTGRPLTKAEYEQGYMNLVRWACERLEKSLPAQEYRAFMDKWDWDDPDQYEEIYAEFIQILVRLGRLTRDEARHRTYQEFRGHWVWDNKPLSVINNDRAKGKHPGDTLEDDATGFLAFKLTNEQVVEAFGHSVPIMSTEGGLVVNDGPDGRYPRNGPDDHLRVTLWINDFLEGKAEDISQYLKGKAPDWYFTVFHWLIANRRIEVSLEPWETQCWYTHWWDKDFGFEGELPTVEAVKAVPSQVRAGVENDAVIRGVILEATGAPASEGIVRLHRDGEEVFSTPIRAGGRFHFVGLVPGSYDLTVDGVLGRMASGLQIASHTTESVQLTLPSDRSGIKGTVTDRSGRRVRGLVVTARKGGRIAASAPTDAKGRYRLAILAAGTYDLTAGDAAVSGIRLNGQESRNVALVVSEDLLYGYEVITKRLLSPEETKGQYHLYGLVLDENGRPIDGVKIQMSWTGAKKGTVFPITSSGADVGKPRGYFEFIPTQGEFQLQVVQGDWDSQVADGLKTKGVPGWEGQAIAYEVNFQLRQVIAKPARSAIRGTVIDEKGAKRAGLKLILRLAGQEVASTVTDASGRYQFTELAEGSYSLEVEGVGLVQAGIELDGIRVETLDLVVKVPPVGKPLYHYLLFASPSTRGTRANFRAAFKYIMHFAPTVGFNPTEATRAQHVTIIGDSRAVSEEDERRLKEAGCHVERLAGDSRAVARALNELVRAGKRFLNL